MKLSEAIRLGSMIRPQAHGRLYKERRKYILFGPVIRESCAMGAAYEAAGCGSRKVANGVNDSPPFRGAHNPDAQSVVFETPNEWQPIMCSASSCPVCEDKDKGYRIIAHLNDKHEWTREAIADWVEGIEREVCPDAEFLSVEQERWK